MNTDLTPCQEHVQMLRTSGLFAAGGRSLWDTDTDKPDAAQRQAIADAKAGCVDCHAFDACRLELDARMRDGEDVTGIVAGTDRRDRDALRRRQRRARGGHDGPSRAGAVPIDHGTARGWRQHRNRSEEPCKPCADAHDHERTQQLRALLVTRHGTKAGYDTHRRLGERPCADCTAGAAAQSTQQRQKRRREKAA